MGKRRAARRRQRAERRRPRADRCAGPTASSSARSRRQLVEGLFECVDLGPQQLKGVDAPLRVYAVRGETGAQSRLEAGGANLSPLVGRSRRAGAAGGALGARGGGRGSGRAAERRGGAGEVAPPARAQDGGSPANRTSSSNAAARPTSRAARCFRSSTCCSDSGSCRAATRRSRRSRGSPRRSRRRVPDMPDAAALLAGLFSIPLPAQMPPLDLSPQRRKERTLEVLVAILAGMAARAPVLFAVEDLHWIDPSTLELLELVVRRAPPTACWSCCSFGRRSRRRGARASTSRASTSRASRPRRPRPSSPGWPAGARCRPRSCAISATRSTASRSTSRS